MLWPISNKIPNLAPLEVAILELSVWPSPNFWSHLVSRGVHRLQWRHAWWTAGRETALQTDRRVAVWSSRVAWQLRHLSFGIRSVTTDRFRIFDFLSCHSTARGTSSPRGSQATELGIAAVSPVDPILIVLWSPTNTRRQRTFWFCTKCRGIVYVIEIHNKWQQTEACFMTSFIRNEQLLAGTS